MISRHTDHTHLCLSVEGALRQIPKNNKFSFADDDKGRPLTNNQFRDLLKEAKFEGKRVLPMGNCANFDYQKGCLGHGSYTHLHDWEWEQGNG